MDPSVGSRGPLFDDKLDHISFQKLFWSINHLVKVSHKNWSTFLLQKTDACRDRNTDHRKEKERIRGTVI